MSVPQSALHFDRSLIVAPQLTDDGFLRAYGIPCKTGVMPYLNRDGSLTYQRVSKEVLFAKNHLYGLGLCPVVLDHNDTDPLVTPNNWRDVAVGITGQEVQAIETDTDGYVKLLFVIYDQEAIDAILNKDATELSCSYFCEIAQVGENLWEQTRRVPNSIAIVKKGRAGKDAKLLLDSAQQYYVGRDLISIGEKTMTENEKTTPTQLTIEGVTINLDGKDEQALSEVLTNLRAEKDEALGKVASLSENLKQAQQQLEKLQGLEAEATQLKEQIADLETLRGKNEALQTNYDSLERSIPELVRSRRKLEGQALPFLPENFNLDAATETEIKHAVLQNLHPGANLEGKSEDYVAGFFEQAVCSARKTQSDRSDYVDQLKQTVNLVAQAPTDHNKIMEEIAKDQGNAWKTVVNNN